MGRRSDLKDYSNWAVELAQFLTIVFLTVAITFNELYLYPFQSTPSQKNASQTWECLFCTFLVFGLKRARRKKRNQQDHIPLIFWKSTGLMREES